MNISKIKFLLAAAVMSAALGGIGIESATSDVQASDSPTPAASTSPNKAQAETNRQNAEKARQNQTPVRAKDTAAHPVAACPTAPFAAGTVSSYDGSAPTIERVNLTTVADVPSSITVVYAGGEIDNPNGGFLLVWQRPADSCSNPEDAGSMTSYVDPQAAGALMITAVDANSVNFTRANGTNGVFNLKSDKFTS